MDNGGLGSASGEITLDASGALRALNQVSTGLKNLETQGQGTGLMGWAAKNEKALNTVGTGLLGVGAAFLGAFGLATKTAMDFDAQISAVGSVAGASEEQLASLREEALRLGADTTFSASEAASGMEIMLKAGASLESVLNGGTEAVLNLSAATGVDVPLAAETAATAMNTFGVSAEEAADTIAQSANASSLDVNDWALALKSVGPVAASLGLSMDDLAAAMVILGDAGIKGEVGATALRNILLGIADPASEGATALNEWGVATHDANGNMRALEDITHDLAGSWDDMSQAQKIALAEQIAGKDGVAAFMAIMDAQTEAVKNNSDAFDDASARMDATGTVSEQAAARMDNLKGSWEQFQGTIETAMITFTSGLAPAMRTVVDGLNNLLQGVLTLPGPVKTAIAAIAGITGALGVAGGSFLLMLPKIAETQKALKSLGGVTGIVNKLAVALRGLVLNPVFLVAMAAFAAYKTNFLGFGDAVRRVVKEVKNFTKGFSDAWKTLEGNPLEKVLRSIQRGLASIGGENTPEWIAGLARAFGDAAAIVERVTDTFRKFREMGLSPVQAALAALQSVFPGLGAVIAPIRQMVENLGEAFQSLKEGNFSEAFESLGEAVKNFGSMFKAAFDAVDWGALGEAILEGLQSLSDVILDGVQQLGEWFAEAFNAIDWGDVVSTAWDVLSGAGSWILDKLGDIAGALWGWFSGAVSSVNWSGVLSTAWDVLLGVGSWIIDKLGTLGDKLLTWFQGAIDEVNWASVLSTSWDVLLNAGTWIVDKLGALTAYLFTWFWDAVTGVDWGAVFQLGIDALKSAGSWILGKLPSVGTLIANLFTWFWGVATGVDWGAIFQLAIDVLKDAGQWLVDKVEEGATTAYEGIKTWASGIWQGIVDAFQPIIDTAVEMINGLINQLNKIPGVDIQPIGGIQDIGSDAEAAASKVNELELALNAIKSMATGGIFAMDDRSRAAAGVGYTPYSNPYNPTEGGGGSMGGIEYRPLTDMASSFRDVATAAGEMAAAIPPANTSIATLSGYTSDVSLFGSTAVPAFTNTGNSAKANLQPIGSIAGLMAGQLLGTVIPAFLQLSSAAQTHFSAMLSAGQARFASLVSVVTSTTSQMTSVARSQFASMASGITSQVSSMAGTVQGRFSSLQGSVSGSVNAIASAAASAASRMTSSLSSGASQAVSAVRSALSAIPGIVSGIGGSAAATAYSAGANISQSFAAGMRSALGAIQAAAAAMVAAADQAVRAKARIASPSKLAEWWADMIGGGYVNRLEDYAKAAAKAAQGLVNSPTIPGMSAGMYGAATPAGAYATPVASQVTYYTYSPTFLALKSEEWVRYAEMAETAPARTIQTLREARSNVNGNRRGLR